MTPTMAMELERAIRAAATEDPGELARALVAAGWAREKRGKLHAGDFHFNERTGQLAWCPNSGCPLGDVAHWETEAEGRAAIEAEFRERLAAGAKLKSREWTVLAKLAQAEDLLTLVVTTRPVQQWRIVYDFSRNRKTPATVLVAGLGRGFELSHPEAWAEAMCNAGPEFMDSYLDPSARRLVLEIDPYRWLVYRRDEPAARETLAYLQELTPHDPVKAERMLGLIRNSYHEPWFEEARMKLWAAAADAVRFQGLGR